jgi:FdrA protein
MNSSRVRIRRDTYVDSVLLLSASRTMNGAAGVEWAAALMGTPANLAGLTERGFESAQLDAIRANDLVLAAQAASAKAAEEALDAAEHALEQSTERAEAPTSKERPRSLEQAVARMPEANIALISVPGQYATLEAHKALSAGLNVLLFSDHVPVEAEIDLKSRGEQLSLFVMGPGAGTALLGGVGLGFSNAVRRGGVGVIAAAGTGAQEVTALLDRGGAGISHVIGVGGRDLQDEVGGRMTLMAARALEADERTEVILLVSKPPSRTVAETVLRRLGAKPAVAALIGMSQEVAIPPGVRLCGSMEEAVGAVLGTLGLPLPSPPGALASRVLVLLKGLPAGRRAVRGLFSGGTLCFETMVILSRRLGPVHSNTPLRGDWGLPAPSGAHICRDLGEEEFTRSRPHPMIDPESRAQHILDEAADPSTAAILIDVVLGYGAHPDPAGILAPVCATVTRSLAGPAVVAYVLGTDHDPQGYSSQCRLLEEAGCMIAPSAARAALVAAALAARRPEIALEAP